MRSHSYVNSAKAILNEYDGSIPLAAWLKQFFKQHKKYGSKDRKEIAHLCYSFFRLGNSFSDFSIEEKILTGVFLSSSQGNLVLQELKPEWNQKIDLSVDEKLNYLGTANQIQNLIPYAEELSDKIDKSLLQKSILLQPLLYLRLRPGKEKGVFNKLQQQGIPFHLYNESCVGMANSTRIEDIVEINKEAVVQDLNSQKVIDLLPSSLKGLESFEAWDCCAASGGKSILLYDYFPSVQLTVSDIRESILYNLEKRFEQAGIKNYKAFIADLSNSKVKIQHSYSDLIICDAPCSGSGTWGRTPEQLKFFKMEKLDHYSALQKKIAVHASRGVKEKGYFLYITCSVFKRENEEVAAFLQQNTGLKLLSSAYFIGYDKRADTLFASLFQL